VVFDYLKKKFQGVVPRAPQTPEEIPFGGIDGATAAYEERRQAAEALFAAGRTSEALAELETLGSELAGYGSFPLAVAVRDQIHTWAPEPGSPESPEETGREMARRHAESSVRPAPAAVRLPEGVSRVALFQGLTAEEITGLIQSTRRRAYMPGQKVVEEGRIGRELFIVTRGVLVVTMAGTAGSQVRVGTLTVGDVFGEVALLSGKPRTATVTAESQAECLEVSRQAWEEILGRHPRLQKILEETRAKRAELSAGAVLDDMRRRRGAPETR
jgi:cAMP-dependent protein kinase regulator